jgi:hypothetical protein
MQKFAAEEKTEITSKVEEDRTNAQKIARYNQKVDIGFKIAVLLIGLGIVVCSAIATSDTTKSSEKTRFSPSWSLVSTILGGASTALSAFAFTQFNFSDRQRIWQKKTDAYAALIFQLRYLDPDKEVFLKQLETVASWNDYTPLQASINSNKQDNGG